MNNNSQMLIRYNVSQQIIPCLKLFCPECSLQASQPQEALPFLAHRDCIMSGGDWETLSFVNKIESPCPLL